MKNILYLVALTGMLSGHLFVSAQNRNINQPPYKFTESALDLQRVILTDTATVLCFRVNCVMHPWALNSPIHLRANNKDYAYRYGKLVTRKNNQFFDSPFTLNSTNKAPYTKEGDRYYFEQDSLVLCFDRIPSDTKTFDFLEGSGKGSWEIYGIKMDGKPYPSSLPKVKKMPDTGLPPYTIKTGKAILRGKIYDYDSKYMKKFGYFGNEYSFTENPYDIKTQIDSLGNFSFEAELSYPIRIAFVFPGGHVNTIMIPGEEMELDIDVVARVAMYRNIWSEKTPKLNKAFQFKGKYAPMNEALNSASFNTNRIEFLKESLAISFDEYVERIWSEYQKNIQEISKQKEYNTQQREYLKLYAQAAYLKKRIDYLDNIEHGMYYSEMKNDPAVISKYEAQYTLIDPHAQELNLFDNLNALYVIHDSKLIEYLKANGLEQKEVYQWMVDLKKAKELVGKINTMEVVKDQAVWNGIAPQYVSALKQQNELMMKKVAEIQNKKLKGTIKQVPDVPGEELIQAIIDSYKGKVVMIDCWATWCGPCKTGIAKMEPVKKELKGKDIVFVYLTNETSDIDAWTKEVANLEGEHYRISKQKWIQLPGRSSIPHYMIYDRRGNKVMEQVGWQDSLVKTFKDTLLKALEE